MDTLRSAPVVLWHTEHCIDCRGSKAQSRARASSSQAPLGAPRGFLHRSRWPAVLRVFPPGNVLHSRLQSLSLLLADRTAPISILRLRRNKRNMSRFSPSLHCCRLRCPLNSWICGASHLKQAHGDSCSSFPITFQNWKGVLLMGIVMFYFRASPKFP